MCIRTCTNVFALSKFPVIKLEDGMNYIDPRVDGEVWERIGIYIICIWIITLYVKLFIKKNNSFRNYFHSVELSVFVMCSRVDAASISNSEIKYRECCREKIINNCLLSIVFVSECQVFTRNYILMKPLHSVVYFVHRKIEIF